MTTLDPNDAGFQLSLLQNENAEREKLYAVMDDINDRYGEFAIAPTSMLARSKMPNVIAPAWKPTVIVRQYSEVNMPEAVMFHYHDRMYTVYFSHSKAVLPVKLKNGQTKLVTWGCREEDNSEMPLGGWARSSQSKNGEHAKWNMYLPRSVKIPVERFMEKNFEGKSCWYEVTKGKYIQGLLARHNEEYRIYIVTIDPEDLTNCHYRWPHIVASLVQS